MPGLWFEDFAVGAIFDHPIRRTVTEMDNTLFCALTLNPAAIHLDAEAAAATAFGQRIVNSIYTLGLMIGISVHDTTLGTTVANLGMEKVVFPKPVFHGDTLHIRTAVLGTRASASRSGQGIVNFRHEAFNQHDDLVASCERAALMLCRPTG
ncbi:MAG: MaoC family dehydratase [Alphaproteobacteria bacterium]|nr:MaoC family dehydratase [Alphaproteobacteria bacterium]